VIADDLWRRAVATLDGNWADSATVPAGGQYPHQWSWDSAFISIGWARCDPGRARTELMSLFAGQWQDGRLPHIVFNAAGLEDSYFPGPAFWDSRSQAGTPPMPTSGLVQPPVHARAVLAVYEADPADSAALAFLRDAYGKLTRWHRYLRSCRDLSGSGLAAIMHPWESGMDNSPLWDMPLAAVRIPAGQPGFTRRDTAHVDARQRPTDRDYEVYVALAAQYRDNGYDDRALGAHQFLVEDPAFNAIFLDAELCMARIAASLGLSPGPHRRWARELHDALLARLWDERLAAFTARDLRTGQVLSMLTIASLMPLLDPWLPPATVGRLTDLAAEVFARQAPHPMPSVPLDSPAFDRGRYWRGPTWMNTNWLVWTALRGAGHDSLADRIAQSSLRLVAANGFREYYDPIDGTGLGVDRFSWSAALTLDWLADPQVRAGLPMSRESA
jgi:glycogen debranching enzyme